MSGIEIKVDAKPRYQNKNNNNNNKRKTTNKMKKKIIKQSGKENVEIIVPPRMTYRPSIKTIRQPIKPSMGMTTQRANHMTQLRKYVQNMMDLNRPFLIPRGSTRPLGNICLEWEKELGAAEFGTLNRGAFIIRPNPEKLFSWLYPNINTATIHQDYVETVLPSTNLSTQYFCIQETLLVNTTTGYVPSTMLSTPIANLDLWSINPFGKTIHSPSIYVTGSSTWGGAPQFNFVNPSPASITCIGYLGSVLQDINGNYYCSNIASTAATVVASHANGSVNLTVNVVATFADLAAIGTIGFIIYSEIVATNRAIDSGISFSLGVAGVQIPNAHYWVDYSLWNLSPASNTCKIQYETAAGVCVSGLNAVLTNTTANLNMNGELNGIQLPSDQAQYITPLVSQLLPFVGTTGPVNFRSGTIKASTGLAWNYVPSKSAAYDLLDVDVVNLAAGDLIGPTEFCLGTVVVDGPIAGGNATFILRGRINIELDTEDKSVFLRRPPTDAFATLASLLNMLSETDRFSENPEHIKKAISIAKSIASNPLFQTTAKLLFEAGIGFLLA